MLNEFNRETPTNPQKVWSAKKSEIMQMWKNVRPDLPIIIQPLSDSPAGGTEKSTYGEDGIRITGSWQFISSVLGRLKDVLNYENPHTKLKLVFRGIDNSSLATRQSYVFYVNVENRKRHNYKVAT